MNWWVFFNNISAYWKSFFLYLFGYILYIQKYYSLQLYFLWYNSLVLFNFWCQSFLCIYPWLDLSGKVNRCYSVRISFDGLSSSCKETVAIYEPNYLCIQWVLIQATKFSNFSLAFVTNELLWDISSLESMLSHW